MKKITVILTGFALAMFVACGGGATKSSETTENATPDQSTVSESASSSSSGLLGEYEAFVEKAVPLLKKMKSGDTDAALEYSKLAQELSDFLTAHQEEFAGLSEEESEKYQALAQKLIDAVN
jgi:FlaG/FlaF family flagellin (archaellin)